MKRPPSADLLGLAAVCLVAFAVRALDFASVFPGDGEVVLAVGDGLYHARSSLYALVNFPELLVWDPYLGFPSGSSVPVPPLPDLLAASVTRAIGGDAATLEYVLAWIAPVCGALTPIAVYAAARVLAGTWVALGAAAIFALLPIVVGTSRVGDADHHALVNGLGAVLLALVLALSRPEAKRARRLALAAGLVLTRAAILLSWSGSLLYVVLAEGSLLLVAGAARRRDLLGAEAASAAATAALLVPVVLSLPVPARGPWSAISLSWLHVCALGAAATVAVGLDRLEAMRPASSAAAGLLRLAGVGLLVGTACLALPGLREGLAPGVTFVSVSEQSSYVTTELMPLFPLPGRPALQPATRYFGGFAYLLPLAPIAALLAARRRRFRGPALVLDGWTATLAALTIWQVRFGADLAASASIAFALLLGAGGSLLIRLRWPPPAARSFAAAVLLALLWTPLSSAYLPRARAAAGSLRGTPPTHDRTLASPDGSLKRFLESVRSATPETAGFLDATATPEYGVLNRMRIGHAIRWWGRRAPTADGLLDVVAPAHFADARDFFELREEGEALLVAERLRARYVITMFFPGIRPATIGARLQHHDGAGAGGSSRPLAHFRLVTEGPEGGRPLSDLFGLRRPRNVVPYKLFEIVPGALIEANAPAGETVRVTLELLTPLGRSFEYRRAARAGADGVARLRVPYATDRATPTRALALYRVEVGAEPAVHRVPVAEDAVRNGATIRVPATPPPSAAP